MGRWNVGLGWILNFITSRALNGWFDVTISALRNEDVVGGN